ncbi:MAG: APC family permease [Anaerolineae bacterium]
MQHRDHGETEVTGTAGGLKRELGLAEAVAVGLGAIVGAGLFVVTGVAAGVAGPAFLVGLVLAAGVAACNAMSSAQLAATFPQSGGSYEYGYRLLHPLLGFSAGWMFLASKLAAAGTVALGFAGYLGALLPFLPQRVSAVVAIVALTGVNYVGIKKAGRLNIAVVAITLLSLLYFVIAGVPAFRAANLLPFSPNGWPGILESAALLFFAYTGYARLATLGDEVRSPRRTIPLAIMVSLGISALLYGSVALVAVGAVGAPELAASSSPLQRAALSFGARGASRAVAVAATTAMLGVLLSQILGISRMLYAMAQRGDMPAALGHVHPRYSVPDRGILLTGAVAVLVALLGTLQAIVSAAAFTILVYYSITNIAALRLQPEQRRYPQWVAVAGLVGCVALALSLQPVAVLSGAGLLVVGHAWRAAFRALFPGTPSPQTRASD